MILAFDTSSAACTAALFDGEGRCLASADELIGRGHSERLVPMIAEVLEGARVGRILVGTGPGSFTGIRVAVAAAHGLAIGWGAELRGFSSLALLAAAAGSSGPVGAAVTGGHGELFVQDFDGATLEPFSALVNATPAEAAAAIGADLVVGSGAAALVAARGWGEAVPAWPSARAILTLPAHLRELEPRPIYARAPDARPRELA
jgi:tRNA threonylcarbamoyladenosine biosynthesis protein TsaB